MQHQDSKQTKKILFFGNSLTAGYGLADSNQSFPSIIQTKINTLHLPYSVINAGLSGETTAGGKTRINGLLNQSFDIFVLELGANDVLRGVPATETYANLQTIIDKVKTKHPAVKVVLLGMKLPSFLSGDYAEKYKTIFTDLATKNNLALVPYLLENVAGNAQLNLRDGLHPNAEGYKIVAENVWKVLKNEL